VFLLHPAFSSLKDDAVTLLNFPNLTREMINEGKSRNSG